MKTLLIDVGNSRVKGRVIDTRSASFVVDLKPLALDRLDRLSIRWRLEEATRDGPLDLALISNVAGDGAEPMVGWLREKAPMARIERVVSRPTEAGVVNGYRHPARLGTDRWMALIGAHAMMPDRSLLVCGFGTATTLDLLRHDGARGGATFIGGFIVPGFEAMRAALVASTVHLDVTTGAVVAFADNTEDAISSGVMAAQVGALREAWREARERITGRLECIVAGGASPLVMDAMGGSGLVVHRVPDLVLQGLAVVANSGDFASARARNRVPSVSAE